MPKIPVFIYDFLMFRRLPLLSFYQTIDIYKLLLSIEKTDKEVECLYNKLPDKAITQFAYRCLIDEIILTNNIEGVHSTRKEINAMNLSYNTVNKYLKSIPSDVLIKQKQNRWMYYSLNLTEFDKYIEQSKM